MSDERDGELYWECEDCGYLMSHDEVIQRVGMNVDVKLHECKCGGTIPDPAKTVMPDGTLLISERAEEEL